MTTMTKTGSTKKQPEPVKRSDEYKVVGSTSSLGYNMPQTIGRALWLPMLAMALMAFVASFVLGIVRADRIASGGAEDTIVVLGHLVRGLMFLGFASVFAAISFAIARILGAFRKGGGEVQEAAGVDRVQTLEMPILAKLFLAGMAMAMMVLLAMVVLHIVAAVAVSGASASTLADSEQWAMRLEAFRRLGVAMYLLAISLGLGAIVSVLRFQAVRMRELPAERS